MRLTPGYRLGPNEIVAPLGAGGMGEVYRARDSRLGREVAIKVLPQHRAATPRTETIESFGFSPDGKRAVVSVVDGLSGLSIADGIRGIVPPRRKT